MVRQENFTAMKGHCAVGTKIKMRPGEIFEIKDSGRYKKMDRIEEIHLSLVNGQRRQMGTQIERYGLYDFFADYKAYLQELYNVDACFEYFTDCVISYNRITNR